MRHFRGPLLATVFALLAAVSPSRAATIDRIRTAPFGRYVQGYQPTQRDFMVLGDADTYEVSDGTSWVSGAGAAYPVQAGVSRVDADGSTLRFTLDLPTGSRLFQRIDYSFGDHSSVGRIDTTGPLVLVADAGSHTGTISGYGRVISNAPANAFPPRFNYFTAPIGSFVPFRADYTLEGASTFTTSTFDAPFAYRLSGVIGLADYVPEPTGVAVVALGACLLLGRSGARRR
jgi:hypothetical protein